MQVKFSLNPISIFVFVKILWLENHRLAVLQSFQWKDTDIHFTKQEKKP